MSENKTENTPEWDEGTSFQYKQRLEKASIAAMLGLCANSSNVAKAHDIAKVSVIIAKELLKQLDQ